MPIRFGTDGWRGLIADDFTFDNVAKVAQATANYFRRKEKIRNGIVVGYDARFLSRAFAETTAEVLGNAGIHVKLASSIATTPMVSLAVKKLKAAGAVIITASHNPAQYNGFKIRGEFAGPAYPEQIAKVEEELREVLHQHKRQLKKSLSQLSEEGTVEILDLSKIYLNEIRAKVDLKAIKGARLRILYDAMFGAGQGVLQQLVPNISTMHNEFNPSFGGIRPEPMAENLIDLSKEVRRGKFDIGLATDGDADRVGAVDEKGNFVDSHRMFALLLKYFVEVKHLRGEVAKSLSVTQMINKMCDKYGLTLHETPVGFKHLCKMMVERNVLIAGEESGGIGIRGHVPERDGILVGLLLCEIMAKRKMSLSALVQELFDEYGEHYFNRIDLHITETEKQRIMRKFDKRITQIAGEKVIRVRAIDGFQYFIDGGWLLVRPSGTEPLIRFYAEADKKIKVRKLLESATRI
jgi:alpha-D-glucose phosphate-specific phosphoglucomutase